MSDKKERRTAKIKRFGEAQYGAARLSMVRRGSVWCGAAHLWCGVAQLWCGVAQLIARRLAVRQA
jgi:hypothetical protein